MNSISRNLETLAELITIVKNDKVGKENIEFGAHFFRFSTRIKTLILENLHVWVNVYFIWFCRQFKNVVDLYLYYGMLSHCKKKGNTDTCSKMDKS